MSKPYTGPVIDPHHHLWDLSLKAHPWLAPKADERGGLGDLANLRRNYLPQDYSRAAERQNIVASVHIEAGWTDVDPVGETRWLETLDKRGGIARRYVAKASLVRADAAAVIEAQASFARVVGIRDILSWSSDPARRFAAHGDLMTDSRWRAGLAELQRYGLVFDLMVFPAQLADAARLASDFPNQIFVLNHGGSPIDRDVEGMSRWRDGIAKLAQAPNVFIKISDLVAYDADWTLDSLRPVIRHCIECFGPDRAMFASDFPVTGLRASFDQAYGVFRAVAAEFSRDEQAALFFGVAQRVYRVEGDAL
jgi:predicted TIM-barrel fold metal-dependent hydrolase